MPINRLNHAVSMCGMSSRVWRFTVMSWVSRRSPSTRVFPARRFSVPPDHPTITTSGCSRLAPTRPVGRPGVARLGCITWRGRSTPSAIWSPSPGHAAQAGALVGASDHGTTKSLYGHDPSGLEFEIAWVVPAALLDANASAGARIRPLDLAREIARYGGTRSAAWA